MSNNIPDWVKHVRRSHVDFQHLVWCGERATGWDFVDAEHAAENGRKGGRLVACKGCTVAIIKALQNGQDDTPGERVAPTEEL